MMRSGRARWVNIAFLAGGLIVGSNATCMRPSSHPSGASDSSPSGARAVLDVRPAFAAAAQSGTTQTLADVAERVVPSVVNISATRSVKTRAQGEANPTFEDPLFQEFFHHPLGPSAPQERQMRALGSGVIVSADGVVLTSAHVVNHADRVEVTLSDGSEYDAKVAGIDTESDLAVVRLEKPPAKLVPLPIGDSQTMRLGDVVLAVGDPFGVGETVTMGIISATGRASVGIEDYEDFIQTDAAINPGNSGGALVNMRGQLIGINTAILSRTGGYQGIGFAIPTSMAKPIMTELIQHGKVTRGWLGVTIQQIDRDLGEALSIKPNHGILVADVAPGSPAAKAGLQRGDVIRTLGGVNIKSTALFRNRIAALGPGSRVTLGIIRDGKNMDVQITLGKLAEERPRAGEEQDQEEGQGPGGIDADRGLLAGLHVVNLSATMRHKLEVPARIKGGAVVADVKDGSAAERVGLQPGDVILEINHHPVSSAAAFRRINPTQGDTVVVLVFRGGTTVYLAARR